MFSFGELPAIAGSSLWPLIAAALGLLAGSLANVLIDRLPRAHPFAAPLMVCVTCGARDGVLGALPILGWVARRGRCASFRCALPMQRPIVEAVNGVLWLLIAGANEPGARSISTMAFVTALLVLSLIDLEHQLLPDVITLPGIALGVAGALLPHWPIALLDAALSAGVGYFGMMALARAAQMYYGEEAIGQGDWKMVAMLGAFMGSARLIWVMLIANVGGALIGLLLVALLGDEGRQRLPLGTFLGAAGIVMTFF